MSPKKLVYQSYSPPASVDGGDLVTTASLPAPGALGGGFFTPTKTKPVDDMDVSKNRGTQNGWFIMENPIKMDDLGVPVFLETPMYFGIFHCHVSFGGVLFFCYDLPSLKLTAEFIPENGWWLQVSFWGPAYFLFSRCFFGFGPLMKKIVMNQ